MLSPELQLTRLRVTVLSGILGVKLPRQFGVGISRGRAKLDIASIDCGLPHSHDCESNSDTVNQGMT